MVLLKISLSANPGQDGTPPPLEDEEKRIRGNNTKEYPDPDHPDGCVLLKERKKKAKPREGWEDGTPPPHRTLRVARPVSRARDPSRLKGNSF